MPLSELIYRLSKEKFDSSQTDLPHRVENDFGELVWEKGQIQSSRGRKLQNSTPNLKIRDKDSGNGNNLTMGRFGIEPMRSGIDEVPVSVHQDDDMVPWLNYPVDDLLQQDYCSEFLSELSGVTVNDNSQSTFTPLDRRNSSSNNNNNNNNQSIRELPKVSRTCTESSFSYLRPRVLSSNHHETMNRPPPSASTSSSPGLLNFAHFSRPAVKSNLHNIEKSGSKDKISPNESVLVDTFRGFRKETNNAKPFPAEEQRKPETLDESTNDIYRVQVAESVTKGLADNEKTFEPIVTSSSVCSGNSVERASDEPPHNLKRKSREADSSEGPSEENEEEQVGAKKGAHARGGAGCKRTRAAEVHNLSERRRRDRINEKMRALQELIPNCNKVDKASMLDEAIEYLKTLQLQVQIMSMGSGLYMPSMMGMPHMHAAHMAQFSPMGMGFGMGMPDMIGGSPMMQMPPMHGGHFPGPPMPGPGAMRGMGGSGFPMFGVSSQGLPMQYPCPTMMPVPGRPIVRPVGINGGGVVPSPVDHLNLGPGSSPKDTTQNINSQPVRNDGANTSMNQTSAQCQVPNESGEKPALAQTSEVKDNGE